MGIASSFGPVGGDGPNTALHVWKYTEEMLLHQGSWKDPETVRRFYSGITDQTLSQAIPIHGWDRESPELA